LISWAVSDGQVIKRTVELSRQPSHLCVRDGQLLILRRSEPRQRLPSNPTNLAGVIPCDDLGLLIVDERDTTYSHHALATIADRGGSLVICGDNHLPVGVLLPYPDHTETVWRIDSQLRAGKVHRKQFWTRIVRAKVMAQADLLAHAPVTQQQLRELARRVRSGDSSNVEAHAAKVYWSCWLPDCPFTREAQGPHPLNAMLDYGYSIMRAALARAIVGGGLIPAIGIKHSNRSNAFCLADDLVEPLRPFVDARVRWMRSIGLQALDTRAKGHLLSLLYSDVEGPGGSGPLHVVIHRYVASFVRALEGDAGDLQFIPTSPSRLAATNWSQSEDRGQDEETP
jgi:CRISPR-associated protein Cas1